MVFKSKPNRGTINNMQPSFEMFWLCVSLEGQVFFCTESIRFTTYGLLSPALSNTRSLLHLLTHPSIHPSIHLSIHSSSHVSIHISIQEKTDYMYMSIHASVHSSVSAVVCLSVSLQYCTHVCPAVTFTSIFFLSLIVFKRSVKLGLNN